MSRPASAACHTPCLLSTVPLPCTATPHASPPPTVFLALDHPCYRCASRVHPFAPIPRVSGPPHRPLPPSSANSPSNDRHPRPVICGLSNSPRELFSFAKLEFSPPPPPSPLSPLFHRSPLFVSVYDRASIGDSRVRILSSDRMNSFFSPTRRRTFSFGDGGGSIRSPWNARYAMKFLGVSHRVTL